MKGASEGKVINTKEKYDEFSYPKEKVEHMAAHQVICI